MAKAKKLFTIGYEQTPPKAVLDELEQAGVDHVHRSRTLRSAGAHARSSCRRTRPRPTSR